MWEKSLPDLNKEVLHEVEKGLSELDKEVFYEGRNFN